MSICLYPAPASRASSAVSSRNARASVSSSRSGPMDSRFRYAPACPASQHPLHLVELPLRSVTRQLPRGDKSPAPRAGTPGHNTAYRHGFSDSAARAPAPRRPSKAAAPPYPYRAALTGDNPRRRSSWAEQLQHRRLPPILRRGQHACRLMQHDIGEFLQPHRLAAHEDGCRLRFHLLLGGGRRRAVDPHLPHQQLHLPPRPPARTGQ